MAKKQVWKNNKWMDEDDDISSISIIVKEKEDGGFKIINVPPKEESTTTDTRQTSRTNISWPCAAKNCNGQVSDYGVCDTCGKVDPTFAHYASY